MTEKFKEIKRFLPGLELCMKCGFCQYWCPIYQEVRTEGASSRGKNVLIRQLIQGNLGFTNELAIKINQCTLCMACTENCPAKSQTPLAIIAARADFTAVRGIKFPFNIVYRYLLPRRRLFGTILRMASRFQFLFMPKTKGTIRHLAFFLSALGKGRQIPSIAPKFLRQMIPEINLPSVEKDTGIKVGYFTGCMTDYVFPDLGKHIVEFLNRHGVTVYVPRKQVCCGAPVFLGAGDFATGRKIADINASAFEEVDYIITDCATCASAIKSYTQFLADSPERTATYDKFAAKVKDISEFLVDILKLPAEDYHPMPEIQGKTITWHDPCHLCRYMGVRSQPRKILRSIPEIKFVEMPNADRCCGMAGVFSINYYELSSKIADKKIASIQSVDADIVATGCPGCQIQLTDGAIRNKTNIEVKHLMELIE